MIFNLQSYAPSSEPEMVTLTLTGEGDDETAYIVIDGVKYYAAQILEINKGTNIVVSNSVALDTTLEVFFNGSNVGNSFAFVADKSYTIDFAISPPPFTSKVITITEQ